MKLTFGIECWDAWKPGIRTKEAWHHAISTANSQGFSDTDSDSFLHLSPRQRRRLSSISKFALDVSIGTIGAQENIPSVFASRRGEVSRMAHLLRDICAGDDASPMAFSLSVHNTASGLFSIYQHNTAPSTAIAAGHDTVISALTEACAQLQCGHKKVLLVIYEEAMPELYQTLQEKDELPVASAFLMTDETQFQFSITPESAKTPELSTTENHVTQLITLLLFQQAITLSGERQACLIQPCV